MPFMDLHAAQSLKAHREALGLSPEALAQEIVVASQQPSWKRGTIDPYTIRRAERGFVPSVRSRFVIDQFFGLLPGSLWTQHAWVKVPNQQKVAA